MTYDQILLILAATSIGFVHTIAGPDHYIPFIALSKSKKWSNLKTLIIVIICGIGHILSSVMIGLLGIAAGVAISSVDVFESSRGDIAAWLLISFGLIYTIWGIKKSINNKPHTHIHSHHDGDLHIHEHKHEKDHTHVHTTEKKSVTPWVLFIIFIFGPCEPLIPLLMFPAAKGNYFEAVLVTIFFGIITIFTMLGMTFLGLYGISLLPFHRLEKNMHVISGATILICGIGMKFLGL